MPQSAFVIGGDEEDDEDEAAAASGAGGNIPSQSKTQEVEQTATENNTM